MPSWIEALISGIAAFAATNVDDLFLLMFYFSQANNDPQRERAIIFGQYLGFAVLVFVSVLGYLGTLLIPPAYVGWLGLLPILLGLRELYELRNKDAESDQHASEEVPGTSVARVHRFPRLKWLNPQAASVAAVTMANGSDNIAVYTPLFASGGIAEMVVIVAVFVLLVRVWCFVADWLAENPLTAGPLRRYGRRLMPFVLIAIGVTILIESEALDLILRN